MAIEDKAEEKPAEVPASKKFVPPPDPPEFKKLLRKLRRIKAI